MIEYTLTRVKGRRNLSIYISTTGKVEVKVPYYTSEKRVDDFISSKMSWISKKVEMVKRERGLLPTLEKASEISICGKTFVVDYGSKSSVYSNENILYLPSENVKKQLSKYIKKVFLPYVSEKTAYFAKLYNFDYSLVKTGSATKKWGSCSYKNEIIYSLGLALLPEYLIDYVVLHELCHTKEKNHQKGFYFLMDKIMPDHRERQKKLKDYAPFCGFLKEE